MIKINYILKNHSYNQKSKPLKINSHSAIHILLTLLLYILLYLAVVCITDICTGREYSKLSWCTTYIFLNKTYYLSFIFIFLYDLKLKLSIKWFEYADFTLLLMCIKINDLTTIFPWNINPSPGVTSMLIFGWLLFYFSNEI